MDFIDPRSGSVIANFEGAVNATTLTCNITNEGVQIFTFWSVSNFGGVSSSRPVAMLGSDLFLLSDPESFLNQLTVTNWTSQLDGVTVFCGTGSEPAQANIRLRVYRKYQMTILVQLMIS